MACSADAHPPLSSATLSLPSELMGAAGGSAWAEQRGRPLSKASLAMAAARRPVLRQQGRSAGTWGQVGPTGLLLSWKAHILFSPEETLALAMRSPSLSTCLRQDCHLWLAERFILRHAAHAALLLSKELTSQQRRVAAALLVELPVPEAPMVPKQLARRNSGMAS